MDNALLAEESLFGCLLVEPTETINAVREKLRAADISQEYIRAAYTAACSLVSEGASVDPVAIQDRAQKNGTQIDSGVMREAMRLFVTVANVEKLAEVIHNRAIERETETIGIQMMSGELTASNAVAKLQEVAAGQTRKLPTPLEDANKFYALLSEIAEGNTSLFTPTGFTSLDKMLGGGLVESGVITIAARPGVGKTVVGFAIADNISATGKKVVYESLEMSREQLWARRTGRYTGLSYGKLMSGQPPLTKEEWRAVSHAMAELGQRNLVINDRPASIDDIEAHVRSMGDVDLLVIDHMGLIRSTVRSGSLYEQTTDTSHKLKRLAQSLKIPIISLCQLNRNNESRNDKRPNLSDLRNSGAIEEDSDVVIFLHRPAMYFKEEDKPKPWESQDMEFTIAKNRHGTTGDLYMDFCGMNARIIERSTGFTDTFEPTPFEGGA